MRPDSRVWRHELHGGCHLCCLSRRRLDARAERGVSPIGRDIATRRRAAGVVTGRHAVLRSWLRSIRATAFRNQSIFPTANQHGTIPAASSRISPSSAAIRRWLHVWGLFVGGFPILRAEWRPADRKRTTGLLLSGLSRSVRELRSLADGHGNAMLWNVTATSTLRCPKGPYRENA
jgi:hypothetical protein